MPSLTEIKNTITDWPEQLNTGNNVRHKLQSQYYQKLKSDLTGILGRNIQESEIYACLEEYLKNNWDFVKGNCLNYTALNNPAIVQDLSGLAELISTYKNKTGTTPPITALQILMPGLDTDSHHNDFYDLGAITKCQSLSFDEINQLRDFDRYLVSYQNIDVSVVVDSQKEYINELNRNSCLTHEEVNKNIQDYLQKNNQDRDEKNALIKLYYLEKRAPLQKKNEDYNAQQSLVSQGFLRELDVLHLQNAISLDLILRTHILSSDQRSLIPLRVITMDGDIRPYHDYLNRGHLDTIAIADENRRLEQHSNATNIIKATLESCIFLDDKAKVSLYDNLQELLKAIKLNDSAYGVGREDSAGAGAYPAIIKFVEYYNSVEASIKEQIATELRNEIELLISLASDSQKNINATENIQTCIGSMRQTMEPLVSTHKDKLVTMAITNDEINRQKAIARDNHSKGITDFLESLKRNSYFGTDYLSIRKDLLEMFSVTVTVTDEHSLTSLLTNLSEEDCRNLCEDSEIKDKILRLATNSPDVFVMSLCTIPARRLGIVIDAMSTPLLDSLDYCKTLGGLLEVVGQDSFDAILSVAQNKGAASWEGILHSAIQYRLKMERFQKIIQEHPKDGMLEVILAKKDKYGDTVLHKVANLPELLKEILSLYQDNAQRLTAIEEKNNGDQTVLHRAARYLESLKEILSLYQDSVQKIAAIQAKTSFGQTVLQISAHNPESLKEILSLYQDSAQKIADIEATNEFGETVLHVAARNPDSLKEILSLYQDNAQKFKAIQATNEHGRTVLHIVARYPDSLKEILSLLSENQKLEATQTKDKNGHTILHRAARYPESIKAILSLYQNNAQKFEAIQATNLYGETVLHIAACNHHNLSSPDSLKELLLLLPEDKRLEAIQTKDKVGQAVLHRAAENPESVRTILSLLPEDKRLEAVQTKDNDGQTVLHIAARHPESLKVILSLLPEDKRLEATQTKCNFDQTVLHRAAGNYESLKVILSLYQDNPQKLAAIQAKAAYGQTVLHLGAHIPQSIKEILSLYQDSAQKLADIRTKNEFGETVLHIAALNPDSLKEILPLYEDSAQKFKAIQAINKDGRTVLHIAAMHPESLKEILSSLPEDKRLEVIQTKDEVGHTVLHIATENPESLKEISALLPNGSMIECTQATDEAGPISQNQTLPRGNAPHNQSFFRPHTPPLGEASVDNAAASSGP